MFVRFGNSQINQKMLENNQAFYSHLYLSITIVNHFLRIRANIAVLKTPGMIRKGKLD